MSETLAESQTISITVNGEPRSVPDGCHVAGLLGLLSLDSRKVAVERNEAIVPRSLYTQTILKPGDSLEIVQFIGGG